MPLEDGYSTEKELSQQAAEIAQAITEFFGDNNLQRGFCLFLVDLPTGVVQYISDLKRDEANAMMKKWLDSGVN